MKYRFPTNYGDDETLICIDVALLPLVGGALRQFEIRGYWASDADYEQGYNAFAQLQAEFMGRCIEKLQMEIRAMRGVDELDPNYNDPDADPFTLQMGHIEKLAMLLEGVNAKLEAIRLLVEGMQSAETLEDIKNSAAQIAVLLA